jgi:hypothetical protein
MQQAHQLLPATCLLVIHSPVDLVVVTSAQVNHDVLVSAEQPAAKADKHQANREPGKHVSFSRQLGSSNLVFTSSDTSSPPEEEHGGTRVVQLIHSVEVWHLRNVYKVDDCKVLDLLGDTCNHKSMLGVECCANAELGLIR